MSRQSANDGGREVSEVALIPDADIAGIVRGLRDESEIRAVLARYARGIDRFDADLVRSCYHDDATHLHGGYRGSAEGFIEYALQWADKVDWWTHWLCQSTIELDGDSAWVETYCLCLTRMRPEAARASSLDGLATDTSQVDRIANIRYVDHFERRDGVWRIARRKLIYQPGRIDPVIIDAALAEGSLRGANGRDDPSYDRRPESFRP
jgi:ketosteroid isomerase-like protein